MRPRHSVQASSCSRTNQPGSEGRRAVRIERDRGTYTVEEHQRLEIFLGTWINEGDTITSVDIPAVSILTSDVYEWIPGECLTIRIQPDLVSLRLNWVEDGLYGDPGSMRKSFAHHRFIRKSFCQVATFIHEGDLLAAKWPGCELEFSGIVIVCSERQRGGTHRSRNLLP